MMRVLGRAAELLRVLVAAGAAVGMTVPFLTGRLIGGTDARWYAYMLADFLEQMRVGRFGSLAGQGSFAWNGGVHPFRSAPMFMWIAGFWNALTLERHSPPALQHLTVVTCAVVGTVGFYFAASRLIPFRKWEALLVALLYLLCPAWLALVICSDAYMSYMAFAALPLVLYGNARCALEGDGRGYLPLSAGLALVWMCHPPIATLATLASVFIQGGVLLAAPRIPWARLAVGAAWFAGLAAYYFASMSEIPSESGNPVPDTLLILGIVLFLIGFGGFALWRRGWPWAAAAAGGAALIAGISRPWLEWAAIVGVLSWTTAFMGRRSALFDASKRGFEILFLAGLASSALVSWALGVHPPGQDTGGISAIAGNTTHLHEYLWPLRSLDSEGVYQLGLSVWAGLAAIALTFLGRRPRVVKLFFGASVLLVLCFFRVPAVSDFLEGYFPLYYSHLANMPLCLRMCPVTGGFAVMALFLWVASGGGRATRLLGILALVVGVAWSAGQARFYWLWIGHQTATVENTRMNFRSENVVLDRYAYDLLPLPVYYSNGVTDPRLETRLRDASGRVTVGPAQAAEAAEARGSTVVRWTVEPIPNSPWLRLHPALTVNPGEHLLLRFAFNPAHHLAGYLIGVSKQGYREYHLPGSGMRSDDLAFGIGPGRNRVLSLWNSGTAPEQYAWTFSTQPGNDLSKTGDWFADVTLSHPDAVSAPIRIESFLPYRVRVTAPADGAVESFRAYLTGYRATVDGRPAEARRSQAGLMEVPVPAGVHVVELRYLGTRRIWIGALMSALAWLGAGALGVRRLLQKRRAAA